MSSRRRHSRHERAGEGISLSIVKRLAELLDATVEVTSGATHGMTFRILLPVFYADQR
ncbi:ATP-binding protein [Paraburkholderia tropica]|uniref:ATP-binding protein n=1 Tax=Paraburkholderia tropica TaxID=92647 RepID=UPI003C6E0181